MLMANLTYGPRQNVDQRHFGAFDLNMKFFGIHRRLFSADQLGLCSFERSFLKENGNDDFLIEEA